MDQAELGFRQKIRAVVISLEVFHLYTKWEWVNRKTCRGKSRVRDTVSWQCLYSWSWRRKQEDQRREIDCENIGWSLSHDSLQTSIIISSCQQKPIPYSHLSSPCFKHMVTARDRPLARLLSLLGFSPWKATSSHPNAIRNGLWMSCDQLISTLPLGRRHIAGEFWPAFLLLLSWTA